MDNEFIAMKKSTEEVVKLGDNAIDALGEIASVMSANDCDFDEERTRAKVKELITAMHVDIQAAADAVLDRWFSDKNFTKNMKAQAIVEGTNMVVH